MVVPSLGDGWVPPVRPLDPVAVSDQGPAATVAGANLLLVVNPRRRL